MRVELYKKYFKNKRVTMMGLGLLGRGIGDALFLAPLVKELLITDKKIEEELKSSIQTLRGKLSIDDFNKIKFVLGEHREEDFVNTDMVMKSAGVPLDSPYIKVARENNVPVYMSAALLTKIIYENSTQENNNLSNVKVIGVTGTRGKSTATMMIAHMLEIAGKRVHLGGNVRGVANLPLLDEINDGDYLLMELDSWQLQGFGDLQISPGIAVFTSFLDDHLNYYKGDREAYFNDKANIFKWQKEKDLLITTPTLALPQEEGIKSKIQRSGSFLQNMHLIGRHNQALAGLVNEVGIQLGLDYNYIVKGISSFKAVEGRLEYMGTFNPLSNYPQGERITQNTIHVYNDNNATTPDAVMVGVEALNEKYKRPITLICGGTDKQLDLTAMVKVITDKSKVDNLILLTGTGTDKLKEAICDSSSPLGERSGEGFEFETLAECIQYAFPNKINTKNKEVIKNTILLYSPGFASFSKYFKNEYEKNDEFVRCVNSLLNCV